MNGPTPKVAPFPYLLLGMVFTACTGLLFHN